ncbi:MAG: radical SAM protein [Spirochaetota bacterium]|nr:radical SAM protein [Spirochaetota bacterium]
MDKEQASSTSDDYIFRYKISNDKKAHHQGSLRKDLLRRSIENILDMVILCSRGKDVTIDGFRLLNNKHQQHNLFCDEDSRAEDKKDDGTVQNTNDIPKNNISFTDEESIHYSYQLPENAALYEPTIEFIKKQLENILEHIELESEGNVVNIDGFRLKKLSHWLEESSCDPADMIGYLATRCNCNCVFCYNKGKPPALALNSPSRASEEEHREIRTRLKYYSPKQKTNLFPTLGLCFEPFIHPHFREVLGNLRKSTNNLIRICTNGSTLTDEMIAFLIQMKPLHLDIALHSSNPRRRKMLMQDNTSEIAIESLPFLKKAGIVYDIVIVPWPMESIDEMIDDMIKTIDYSAKHDVHLVQISLPGFSQYFSEKAPFDHHQIWELITQKVREIRNTFDVPIVTRPTMYEEGLYYSKTNIPEIIGIVKGSPSFNSGLERGDIINKIGSNAIHNRPQARELLSILQRGNIASIPFEITRDGQKLEIPIDLKNFSYPFSKYVDTHLGIVFMGTGFRKGYLESISRIIGLRGAKNILILSSTLVKPLLEQNIRESPFFKGVDLNIEIGIPNNNLFGGNICLGDLLVVQDYIDYIKEYCNSHNRSPDLIIIPSSPFNLSGWGRDLTGRVYLDIERRTGIPVEIVECYTIYD